MTYELLAPAGDLATARIALRYGADAIYLGGPVLQLRAQKVAFPLEDIRRAAEEAHHQSRRVYVTVNAFARDSELELLPAYARQLQDAGIDGAIIADPGVMSLFHQTVPEMPIHVSTQANCTNAAAARIYYALGARRVVPARELTLAQLSEMRRQLPEDMEIEAFVHGAMCMAYSGRCMISAYLTGRSANRGACAHPCRWNYTLMEQTRPGEYFPLEETDDGMALFSSRDLNCLPFLEKLVEAGVTSFKIEGRMKSEYYVATVLSAYRRRLDDILAGRPSNLNQLTHELDCVSHRTYCSGFYFGELKHVGGDKGDYLQGCRYIAQVLQVNQGQAEILLKNKFCAGDTLEAVTPAGIVAPFPALQLTDSDGLPVQAASVPDRIYRLNVPAGVTAGDLLRMPLE